MTLQLLVIFMILVMCIWAIVDYPDHRYYYPWDFDNSYIFFIPVSLVMLCDALFIIPVFLLWTVQWGNFFQGKTTMERFGRGAVTDNHFEEV